MAPCMQVLKLAKKAAKRKQIKRGVKEVIKAIRKNTKGCVPPPLLAPLSPTPTLTPLPPPPAAFASSPATSPP